MTPWSPRPGRRRVRRPIADPTAPPKAPLATVAATDPRLDRIAEVLETIARYSDAAELATALHAWVERISAPPPGAP